MKNTACGNEPEGNGSKVRILQIQLSQLAAWNRVCCGPTAQASSRWQLVHRDLETAFVRLLEMVGYITQMFCLALKICFHREIAHIISFVQGPEMLNIVSKELREKRKKKGSWQNFCQNIEYDVVNYCFEVFLLFSDLWILAHICTHAHVLWACVPVLE